VFVIYPFLVTPLYQTLFTSETSAAQRAFYWGIVGFVIALIGWCVGLVIFLSCRGPGPNATLQAPPVPNPMLGPGR
jgi:hypothetical protein